MLNTIIEFSSKNRLLIFLLTIMLSLASAVFLKHLPLDAIPDLSETQVIVYSKWDRSPDIIEDQVTYPIISSLLGAPKVKDIRGFSDFGYSYVYVIFEEGVDPYWARSRVLEYLSKITSDLPQGVKSELGPDATGVGWVFQYALVDKTGKHSLADLRSYQDWFLRYTLQMVPGVSEVAAIGGMQKQYQVKLNPRALLAHKVTLSQVVQSIREANQEVGARVIEIAGAEYMIRGKGYIHSLKDIENIVIGEEMGSPITIRHVAEVTLGPDMRRGVADLDGEGDSVGGIVIMRYGENALRVIERVKNKIEEIRPNLPEGMELLVTYDRSDLIKRAVDTLTHELILEMIVVSLVILIFLMHIPSALIPIITLPLAVLMSFIPMAFLNMTSNIMSLGGIAIAIGAMVDASIVMVENVHKHLEEWELQGKNRPIDEVILEAMKEVGPASFYSLLVIAASFIPIFALEGQEGKLFKPLAYTKNLSMIIAAILSITLDPALRMALTRFTTKNFSPAWASKIYNSVLVGEHHAEEKHPISRFCFKYYGPLVDFCIEKRWWVVATALMLFLSALPLFWKLGSEFMPPLNEGAILYMPTTFPGISVTEAQQWLQKQDQVLKSFPEVERVFGKAGRAETATDPAPFSMVETVVLLKPQREWREVHRWYSDLPSFFQAPFKLIWPSFMSYEELIEKLNKAMQFPGTTNAWTMPIKNRIDMLTTGMKTPVGIKVLGGDLKKVEEVAISLETLLQKVKGTRSVFAERVSGGYYLDIVFLREQLARYGISIQMAQESLVAAIGGEVITRTVEGRERYGVTVRYFYDYRSNLDSIKHLLIPTPSGAQIPLGQVAELRMVQGPAMIRNENGLLSSYVYIDMSDSDVGHYVQLAKQSVQESIKLPSGISLVWSGQYEHMERVKEKLTLIIPMTLFIILMLIYLNTKQWTKTFIVMLAAPFSAIGAIWILWLAGYNMSIAVWVGILALLGVDAETGIFMLLYLDISYQKAINRGKMSSFSELKTAIHEGAVKRIRPKLMTVTTLLIALIPIMLSSTANAGADVMKRIAAPMFGGIMTSFGMELLVYPAIYAIWKERYLVGKKTVQESIK